MENLADDEELVRQREFADQLRCVLNEGGGDNGSTAAAATATPFPEQLVNEVLMSFTNTTLFLKNPTSASHEVTDVQCKDPFMSVVTEESNCKSSAYQKPRGCNKRRITSQKWTEVSEIPKEDGHQWRKYGQKEILGAKYPRSYYRCIHGNVQGCIAKKQVQRIQEDPPLHETTYRGRHTCRNLQNNSFPTPAKQDCPFLSSSFPSSLSSAKRECKEEIPPSSSPNDYLMSSELTFDDSQRHVTLSSTLDSDHHMDLIPHVIITPQTGEGSEMPMEDGFQWRKYGQKMILNAKYPRNYYRCIHRSDQGCRATKQVQRIQEDPPLHETTYRGRHTCRNLQNLEIIVNSDSRSDSVPTPTKQDRPFLSSSFPSSSSSAKRECNEEIPPSSSPNDYLISSELTSDDSQRHVTLSSILDSDHHMGVIPDVMYDSDELG